jgi:WD40 repeat protein
MHTFSKSLLLGLLTTLLSASALSAEDLQVLRLAPKWTGNSTNYNFGLSNSELNLAISDKWILIGSTHASEQANRQGAIQLFDAVTGAWVRKILPPAPATANEQFGDSCVIAGDLAVISSDRRFQTGKVYIYDLKTGAKLRELIPPTGTTDYFGETLAVSGDTVLVGATDSDGYRGAVHVFSLRTGLHITKLQPSDTVAADYFGDAIATDGPLAVITATSNNSGKGSAYLYDLRTATLVKKLSFSTAVANQHLGYHVAMTEGKVVLVGTATDKLYVIDTITGTERVLTSSDTNEVGISLAASAGLVAAGSSDNIIYVFDLRSTSLTEMQKIPAPVGTIPYFSREGIAMHNGSIISQASDNLLPQDKSCVFVFRTVTRPLPMTSIAQRGSFTPGSAETTFNMFGDAFINLDGEVAFLSTLIGAGSNAGKDNGLWSTMGGTLDLVLKSRQLVAGSNVVSIGTPLINQVNASLYTAKLSGTGITTANNQVVMKDDGTATSILWRAGNTNNPFGGARIESFTKLVQSTTEDRAAAVVKLRTDTSTSAADDTGLIFIQPAASSTNARIEEGMRENSTLVISQTKFGQFTGRVSLNADKVLYSAALQTDAAHNSGLFLQAFNQPLSILAQRGNPAPGTAIGTSFSTFIGETQDDLSPLFRATLSAPATSANNEGLWSSSGLVMRKGDLVTGLTGVKIARFINYWRAGLQTIALVQLSGTGVTAANDTALLLSQDSPNVNGVMLVLLREGDPAPGCAPATIGVISRVEVETYNGQYLVLATLAGAPAGSNQVLLRGASRKDALSLNEQYLRRPIAVLRKGERYTGYSSKLKSISLPATNITPAGAGGSGMGSAMRRTNGSVIRNDIVLTLEFENGIRQIMRGIP